MYGHLEHQTCKFIKHYLNIMLHRSSHRGSSNDTWFPLLPAEPRDFPFRRTVRILLRSAHIFATGTLVGGYIFNQPTAELMPWLWGSVVTGILLMATDLHASVAVLCEARGIAVVAKVVLFLLVPVFWEARVPLLVIILLIGAASSHMPKRVRHRVLIFPNRFAVDVRGG